MAYKAQVMPAAAKQLEKLPRIEQARIVAAIHDLEDDPRPPGSVKLAGTENLWRIRVGDYRMIYEIHDDRLVVLVVRIGHRRDIYRRK
jgi:mRNA interferase RelE/StbE